MRNVPILTVKQVNAIKKNGLHCLGGAVGLYLFVRPSSRIYVYRYTSPVTGRVTSTSVGHFSQVTLAYARAEAQRLAALVRNGIDPVKVKQQEKARRRNAMLEAIRAGKTFKDAADEWLSARVESGYYDEDSLGELNVRRRLKKHILPIIGNIAMSVLTAEDLFKVLKPFWVSGSATRAKIQVILNGVCRWSVAKGYCSFNVADTRGTLGVLLENVGPRKKAARNHGSLAYQDLPGFMREVLDMHAVAADQLAFAILTASRAKPVRMAKWEQVDFEKRIWVCNEHMMKVKGRGTFVVYLSDQAIEILKRQPRRADTDLIFPKPNGFSLSENAMANVIKRIHERRLAKGEDGIIDQEQTLHLGRTIMATQHGISRATFKTWTKSEGNAKRFNADAVELCLAHQIDTRYNGAYDRASMEQERREVMQAWGDFCFSAK